MSLPIIGMETLRFTLALVTGTWALFLLAIVPALDRLFPILKYASVLLLVTNLALLFNTACTEVRHVRTSAYVSNVGKCSLVSSLVAVKLTRPARKRRESSVWFARWCGLREPSTAATATTACNASTTTVRG